MASKPCNCGSGLQRYDLKDAAGIFCCYVCERCEKGARANYDPAIFERGSQYSVTGEEEDIEPSNVTIGSNRYGTHTDLNQPWWMADESPEVEYDPSIVDPSDHSATWHSYVVLPQVQS